MSILQMSFSAAVLIVAITVLRAAAINKLPKKTFLVLWAVVVLRLLIPFSVSSPLSAYSLISSNEEAMEKMAETPAVYIFPITSLAQTQHENIASVLPAQNLPEGAAPVPIPVNAAPSPWIIIWAAGAALCAMYFVIAYTRFNKRFQASIIVQNNFVAAWLGEHKIIRHIKVRQSSRIATPLTYGIFRPVILIPDSIDWSDEKQLRYILTHEYMHIRRFDTAFKLLLTAALCVHWFNPVIWAMYILANRDLELTCDESVVRHFGETVKSSYALALVKLEERKNVFPAYYNGFSKNATEERIRAIMKYKKSPVAAVVLAVFLVIGMTSVFAFGASISTNSSTYAPDEGIIKDITASIHTESDVLVLDEDVIQDLLSSMPTDDEIERLANEAVVEASAQYFESYSAYGLIFNKADGRLYYNGQLVRYFFESNIEGFDWADGVIGVKAVKNSAGELVGVESYSQQEFEQLAKTWSTKEELEQIVREAIESAGVDFNKIWDRARDAVFSGVVFWPLPAGQKEADWNYSAWSAVWGTEWQKAEDGGYLEQLKDYVVNKLIIAARESGSWRNLHQELYETSVGLLEN